MKDKGEPKSADDPVGEDLSAQGQGTEGPSPATYGGVSPTTPRVRQDEQAKPAPAEKKKAAGPERVDLNTLYAHMPPDFVEALEKALEGQGLIVPEDFQRRDALEKTRAALLSVVRNDALNIIALAQKQRR